ncbi:MAG: hypothetical protein DRJ40_02425 [Thermoprotei archaeon]|nr:MAG: hypothetical protein DRJ40_02425 [Thermoprotei archaeon]
MVRRRRRRYVVLKVLSSEDIPLQLLVNHLERFREKLFGLLYCRWVNFRIVYVNENARTLVIQTDHRSLPLVRLLTCLVTEVENCKVLLYCLKVTGTLRKAKAQADSMGIQVKYMENLFRELLQAM